LRDSGLTERLWFATEVTGVFTSPLEAFAQDVSMHFRRSADQGVSMQHNSFHMSVQALAALMGGPDFPLVIDVCGDDDYLANGRDIPGALHRNEADFARWKSEIDVRRPVVVSCQKGLKISQNIAARLRAEGCPAAVLTGGFLAWKAAGLPLLNRQALVDIGFKEGGLWVTRRRPKIDRAACPWLITRFIDPNARFLFVDPDQVVAVAARTGGIAYDVEGVTVTHEGESCSFDTLLKIAGLAGFPPLDRLAAVVRGRTMRG
jgi:rhodanese-related sulfurtransferase